MGSRQLSRLLAQARQRTLTRSPPQRSFYWFAGLVNGTLTDAAQNTAACAKLMNDIVINENVLAADGKLNGGSFEQWTPIGGAGYAYAGAFDGQNHTISGLYIDSDSVSAAGLFGCVTTSGTVRNVRVADSYISISGRSDWIHAGGVCAMNSGTIQNCCYEGTVSGSNNAHAIDVGGVCAQNFGTIEACYHTGTVTADGDSSDAGGVCGLNNYGTIRDCCHTGTVTATGTKSSSAGGVCGGNVGTLQSCYNMGKVSASGSYVGGVCGENYVEIKTCYFLTGTANSGIGSGSTAATQAEAKGTEAFSSGEVAWLLSQGQDPCQWVQKLGQEASPRPVMAADDRADQVLRITVVFPDGNKKFSYANLNDILIKYPVLDEGTEYVYFTSPGGTTPIDTATKIYTKDTTIYAKEKVDVMSISLSPSQIDLSVGGETTLKADIQPDDASYRAVTWSSSDATVATVDQNGKVTALKKGTATITAKAVDGSGAEARCAVTVTLPITITPAGITVYTGGKGYTGVVDDEGQKAPAANGLPEPGYYITLPEELNAALGGGADAKNLSSILKFTYEDEQDRKREWKLALYGTEAHSSIVEGTERQRYIYRMLPGVDENGQEIPVRLQFTDPDGNVTISDEFTPNGEKQYQEYTMRIYPGDLETGKITATLTLPGGQTVTRGVKSAAGTLVVRGLTEENSTAEIVGSKAEISDSGITALAGRAVTYYVNGSDVELSDGQGVKLLVDGVLNNDVLVEYIQNYMTEDIPAGEYAYEQRYLDLVDTRNGNAYLTIEAGQTIEVYWPAPDGLDDGTQFYVIHFPALNRNYNSADGTLSDLSPEIITQSELVEINGTRYIRFETGSFSPFVLMWEAKGAQLRITYKANGGTGEDQIAYYTLGNVASISDNLWFTRTGYTFDSWNTARDGSGTKYEPNSILANLNSSLKLYAQWIKNGGGDDPDEGTMGGGADQTEFELHYVTNGGKHLSVESESRVWTKDYEALPVPVREGYEFAGWYWDSRLTRPVSGDVRVDIPTVALYAGWAEEKVDPDPSGVARWLNTVDHRAYLSGYPDGSFGADRAMSRAEVAQMFYALLLDKDMNVTTSFADVPGDAWYARAVNSMAGLGMMGGYPDGTFRPDAPITRAEFITVAMTFAGKPDSSGGGYVDVAAGAWYYPYVTQASTYGWTGGYPDGTFRPDNPITRAEVCVIVNNMLGRSPDENAIRRNAGKLTDFTDLPAGHWAYYAVMEATNAHGYSADGGAERWDQLETKA